jgi:L-threonylcarbamoyladenylate synthase
VSLLVVAVERAGGPASVVARAAALVARGDLLIYPTDTLYALGGAALQASAARRAREAKGRDDGKPLPVVAANLDSARRLARAWEPGTERLAAAFWPGPLTLVLPAASDVPHEVTASTDTIAVRVPGLAFTRALCLAAGPLVSTSANLQGDPAPLTCAEAVAAVGDAAALALDGGPGTPLPSTLVDVTGAAPRLRREGAVPWTDVLRAWG